MNSQVEHLNIKQLIMRLTLSCFLFISFLTSSYGRDDSVIQERFADLGEIQVYYKVAGKGTPIIFLHGGTSTSDSWEDYLNRFSDSFQVIAPDSRGQGQSSLGKGPITYGRMAGDVVKLLDYLNIERAHIVGHSDGGVIALHLLIDYPDRVISASLLGTPYHIDNYPENASNALEEYVIDLKSTDTDYKDIKSRHSAAENQKDWIILVDKLGEMWRTQPTFSEAEIALIDTPVLIVKTDNDYFIPSEVFDNMAKLIQDSQVLYISDGKHSVYRQKPDEVSRSIRNFIQETVNININK